MKKGKLSFSTKMYVFVVLLVVVVSLATSQIAFFISARQIDSYFKSLTVDAADYYASIIDPEYFKELRAVAESEEYQAVRNEAEETENEQLVIDYLKDAGLWEGYVENQDKMMTILDNMEAITYLYIVAIGPPEATEDMYLMDNTEEPVYQTGYIEARELELYGMDASKPVPPTISHGDWGWLCSAFVPVYDAQGNLVCQVGCDVSMDAIKAERTRYQIYMLLGTLAFSAIALILAVLFANREVIKPVDTITDEKEKIDSELSAATKLQSDMLSKDFPDRDDLSLYAGMYPAKDMNGDFYDFFMIDDDHLALVMADVSGKGIPAAMFMIETRTLIKSRAQRLSAPSEILLDVNKKLCDDNPSNLSVAVWLGILTISSGELIYSNAGQEYPVYMKENEKYQLIKRADMPALATKADIEYQDETMNLEKGDRLFLYTDGIPESKNADGKRFGTEKMMNVLNRDVDKPDNVLLDDLKKEIDDFCGEADQNDDITMMTITIK